MTWKCVFVGLALFLPGTLLVAEGRSSGFKANDPADEQLYKALYNFFRSDLVEREPYSDTQEAIPQVEKKPVNSDPVAEVAAADSVVDNPPPSAKTQQAADEKNSNPPAQEPSASQGEDSDAGVAGGQGKSGVVPELNAAVESPKTLALTQSGHGGNREATSGIVANNVAFIMIVAACTVFAAVGIVGAGVCWYKYHKSAKAAGVVDYPAYGVTGPTKDRLPSPGDRKLAHSAQMYHYQHQKQQMMAMQTASGGDMKHDESDDESVEDNEDADYTVYECPGLAPTGEMEVKNPLFRGDDTPSTPANDDSQHPLSEY